MKNTFRLLILFTLVVNFYNAFLGGIVERFSWNTWGTFRAGPFLTVLFVWFLLEAIHYVGRNHKALLPSSLWGFAAFGLLVDSISDYVALFDNLRNYDKLLHFLIGGMLVGFLTMKIIEAFSIRSPLPLSLKYGLTVLMVNFSGFLYEFFEFIIDRFYGARNILDRFDTTADMLLNTLGALTVILLSHILMFWRKIRV